MKSVRVNITLPDVLLSEIDKYASEHQITRSTLLQMAVAEYMRAENKPSAEAFALMGNLARSAGDSDEQERKVKGPARHGKGWYRWD